MAFNKDFGHPRENRERDCDKYFYKIYEYIVNIFVIRAYIKVKEVNTI
jgi:hypothetical protein